VSKLNILPALLYLLHIPPFPSVLPIIVLPTILIFYYLQAGNAIMLLIKTNLILAFAILLLIKANMILVIAILL